MEPLFQSGEKREKRSTKSWMDVGYQVFSEEGPTAIQIERLARQLEINRTGFYLFLGDTKSHLEFLMTEHLSRVEDLIDQIQGINLRDPHYFQILEGHKETVFFQVQLVKNREVELFANTLQQVNRRISEAVVPLWKEYLNLPDDLSSETLETIRELFYTRITPENFSSSWFADFAREARVVAVKGEGD